MDSDHLCADAFHAYTLCLFLPASRHPFCWDDGRRGWGVLTQARSGGNLMCCGAKTVINGSQELVVKLFPFSPQNGLLFVHRDSYRTWSRGIHRSIKFGSNGYLHLSYKPFILFLLPHLISLLTHSCFLRILCPNRIIALQTLFKAMVSGKLNYITLGKLNIFSGIKWGDGKPSVVWTSKVEYEALLIVTGAYSNK